MAAAALNDGCRVHDSVTQCISRQMDRLRIATALVVIRDKPAGQTAREFATSLQIFHRDRVSHLTVKELRRRRMTQSVSLSSPYSFASSHTKFGCERREREKERDRVYCTVRYFTTMKETIV